MSTNGRIANSPAPSSEPPRIVHRAIARVTSTGARMPLGNRWPRLHARIYRASRGRLLRRWFRTPVLVLETTGRRSGKVRSTPVVFARRGNLYAVVAANAGSDREPAWSLNLSADPHATVVHGGQRISVTARLPIGAERDRLWSDVAKAYPPLPAYGRFTKRAFPVWALEPVSG